MGLVKAAPLTPTQRGLIAASLTMPSIWTYWLAWALRTCTNRDFAPYFVVWGPVIAFFVTLPVLFAAFVIGYLVPVRLRGMLIVAGALVVVAAIVALTAFPSVTPAYCSSL